MDIDHVPLKTGKPPMILNDDPWSPKSDVSSHASTTDYAMFDSFRSDSSVSTTGSESSSHSSTEGMDGRPTHSEYTKLSDYAHPAVLDQVDRETPVSTRPKSVAASFSFDSAQEKSTYRSQFEKLADAIEHFDDHPPNFVKNFPNSEFVAAAVGPPARGKSYLYGLLAKYTRKQLRTLSSKSPNPIVLRNAGDLRRVWENEIALASKPVTALNQYFKLLRASDDDRQLWTTDWIHGQIYRKQQRAIPGHLFSTEFGKRLNNYFAAIALDLVYKDAHHGKVAYFDATNTDAPRRSYLIQMATRLKKPLVFLENLCVNPEFLFRSFFTKIFASSDYSRRLRAECSESDVNMLHERSWEDTTLFNWETRLQSVPVPSGCLEAFGDSMNDILKRDHGYLKKYIPLHVKDPITRRSTIDEINQHNRRHPSVPIAYVQTMIPQCSMNPDQTT
jgi:hypothetical protein